MIRIHPDEVVAAYLSTGYTPIRRAFRIDQTDGRTIVKCGCPVAVLSESKNVDISSLSTCRIAELIGYDPDYLLGFVYGFDDLAVNSPSVENFYNFAIGRNDGRSAGMVVLDADGRSNDLTKYVPTGRLFVEPSTDQLIHPSPIGPT
jgi:hypothetical protein